MGGVGDAVGDREFHRLGEEMDRLGAVLAGCRQIVAGEEIECLEILDTAAGQGWAGDLITAIGGADRLLPLRLEIGEIFLGKIAALRLHRCRDPLAQLAAVERFLSTRGDLSIGFRQQWLLNHCAGFRRGTRPA